MQKRISIILAACLSIFSLVDSRLSADQIPADATVIQLEDSATRVATWTHGGSDSYAIDMGDGNWRRTDETSFDLRLRYATFDPLIGVPTVTDHLRGQPAGASENVYIVQFKTQPLEEYRRDVRALGGTIYKYLPQHAYLVRLDPESEQAVRQLPYVRWVGVHEPAYKLDEQLLAAVQIAPEAMPATRVNIMVMERGLAQKGIVAARIAALGGKLDLLTPNGFRIEATLNGGQLLEIANLPEVMWIDLWSENEMDMDLAREISGANYVEAVAGYDGQGVRGEVMDNNLFSSHVDFQASPPIFHRSRSGSDDHGTATYGIVFGDGTGDPSARGMLSSGQGIFADFDFLTDRYLHTSELVRSPYFAVFQSNSWGGGRTRAYTSVSAEMDDIIFIHDILITQSQSNAGNQDSRPQAWSKNIVSVGGIHHLNTLTKNDDFWNNASIGPAADGRIKPDLSHFYDFTRTTDDVQNGYRDFGGTSGATPIVAGHFGLLFQMWSDGIFGNEVDPNGTVFDNRPHASTAKALMINQASSYPFSGPAHNLTRTHQGWGLPDVANLFDARNAIFVVDEEVVLENLQTARFELELQKQAPELRATLVYADPMGTPNSNVHRVNDLTLKVTAPNGDVYWGNNGLLTGNWSIPNGNPNTIDTVENVFVQNPVAGVWTVDVIAAEINEDSHIETGEVDADFGLVVSGVNLGPSGPSCPTGFTLINGGEQSGTDFANSCDSDNVWWGLQSTTFAATFSPPAISAELDGFVPLDGGSNLTFTVEGHPTLGSNNVFIAVAMFNYTSGLYEQSVFSGQPNGPPDAIYTITKDNTNGDYVGVGGEVKARVTCSKTTTGPTRLFIDSAYWEQK